MSPLRLPPAALGLIATLAGSAARAQLPQADSAFSAGDYRAARAHYEAVLERDSLQPRALYRLAVLDSWEGRLERSLARFARVRELQPSDPDLMVAHARVLAWANRHAAAEALYDSALARDSGRADALAGRARTVAWAGDLDRATELWRDALARHPDDVETLVGLAQTLYWKGRADLAERYVARARQLAPEDPLARETERGVRAVLDPDATATTDYSDDSDDNRLLAVEARASGSLGRPDRRGTLSAGWKRATDPFRDGDSFGAAGSVLLPLVGRTSLRAGAGVRRLAPDSGDGSTPVTALVGVTLRPTRRTGVGITYARSPFDETALLIRRGFTLDAVEANGDAWGAWGSASLGGGAAWLSDGNRRLHVLGAVLVDLPGLRGVSLGPFARVLGWRRSPGGGYFAPDRYTVAKLRGSYAWQRHRWSVRLEGGIGGQQVGAGARWQNEWHAGATVSRAWGWINEIALVGTVTNAAATSATGAFRYGTGGVRMRLGL